MIRKGVLAALLVIILGNLIVLIGVARNRAGQSDSVVELTERELPLSHREGENSGISLHLEWSDSTTFEIGRTELEALGFDCSVPLSAETRERHYDKLLPRDGYVVLEFEGESWDAWLDEERKRIEEMAEEVARGDRNVEWLETRKEQGEREKLWHSRLFAVDVGPDPTALRTGYADRSRFIIVHAVLGIGVDTPWDDRTKQPATPRLRGRIHQILVNRIHVRWKYRSLFDSLPDRWSSTGELVAGPRYSVTLEFGRRFEPWISAVRRTESAAP